MTQPHDHTAIMDMLARHAADDTEWDQPMALFALGRGPDDTYGIAPIGTWNRVTNISLISHPPHATLATLVATCDEYERRHPGNDAALDAFTSGMDDPWVRPWWPTMSHQTKACGIVLRQEAWAKPIDPADPADTEEVLLWHAVSDDDHYMHVVWPRGAPAPTYHSWSFKDDLYRKHKTRQRIPTHLRGLMRVSRRAARYRHDTHGS